MQILFDILRSQQADDPFAFRLGHQEYIAHTASGSVATASLDWDEALLADLAALREPGADPALAQRIGDLLRRFLSELGFDEEKALIAQATTSGERVVITLRLRAAELFALPWELFTLRVTGLHAGALPQVMFRYCWPESTAVAPSTPQLDGGRLLFVWSAAGGAVPAAEHLSAIRQATSLGHYPFSVERDVIPHVSLNRLRAALTTRPGEPLVSVLHILCHGAMIGTTYGLAMDSDDASGSLELVDGNQLRQLLAPFAGHLRLVVLSACDSGNVGALGNHLGSLAQALHRAGLPSVIASRFPLSVRGSCVLTETLFRTLIEGPASLETAFTTARQRLVEQRDTLDWASLQLFARPEDGEDTRPLVIRPYRGLVAFQPQDRRLFFGREREVQETLSDLAALHQAGKPRFLVVAGASGSGKSSVVLGGMLPALTQERSVETVPDQRRAAVASLVSELEQGQPGPLLRDALVALQRALHAELEGSGAWEYAILRPGSDPLTALANALSRRRDDSRQFLLIIDQLEEIFTHTADPAVRQSFLQRLWTLSQGKTGLSCVVTLRVDFLGQCAEIALDDLGLRLDRVAYDEAHRIFVAQMSAEQMRAAIEGPARLVGLRLEEGLVQQMIAEVQDKPGALPLMQYVLDILWQRRQGDMLTIRAYLDLGGAAGALGGNAERLYERLSPDAQRLARRLLVRLVSRGDLTIGDTRRRVPLSELRAQMAGEGALFDATVAEFIDARLLVRSEERGQILIEVAHEALLRKWQRLRDWLEEDRQLIGELHELERWAEQYATYKTLLHGAQLGFAQQVLGRHAHDLGPTIIEMVQASVAAQQRFRQQLAALIVIAMLVLSSFAWYGRSKQLKAQEEQRKASQHADTAASRWLTVQASQGRERSSSRSLLLAAHAVWLKDDQESRDTLATALAASRSLKTFLRGQFGKVPALAFNPNGQQLAVGARDGAVYLYQVDSGALKRQLPKGSSGALRALAFSADGSRIAAVGSEPRLSLWELAQDAPPTHLESSQRLIRLDFSADGRWLAAGGERGHITTWDLKARPVSARSMTASDQVVSTLRFFPSGTRLAAGISNGTVQIIDAPELRLVQELHGAKRDVVDALAISPDGKWLVGGGPDEDAERWELSGSAPKNTPLPKLGHAADIFFRPGGRVAIACTTDGSVLLADVTTGEALANPMPLQIGQVMSCAQSPDGATLALGSEDRVVLWDLTTHPALHPGFYPHPVSALAVGTDGTTLALGGPDGSVRFLDIKSDRILGEPLRVHQGIVNGVVYHGEELCSGGGDGALTCIDPHHPGRRRQLLAANGELGPVMSVASHGPSERLAIGTADGWLLLFGLAYDPPRELGRRRILTPAREACSLYEVRFSPDGNTVAAAGSGGTVSRFRTSDLNPLDALPAGHLPTADVRSLDFSPDGKFLASAGTDAKVWLFDLTREPSRAADRPLQNKQAVTGVRFSPNGKLLAAATAEHGIVLWDPNTRKHFGAPLVGHTKLITAMAYVSEQLLFSGDNETIWRWNVDLRDGRTRACARANRNISKADWDLYIPYRSYCRLCTALPVGTGAPADAPECAP